MLKRFGFRRKMCYLCTSEEERARKQRVFSSFFCKNRAKNGCFKKHIEKFICLRKNFLGLSGFFSGQVGERIGDVGVRNVKRNLFFKPAFFPFRVNISVNFH